ncbi:MAG TPA: AAA family ATPase [Kofleriaceae bacterium]
MILTVIPAELEAARRVLQIDDGSREKAPDGTVYFRGVVRSERAGKDYAIALTCIGGAGNPGAAAATAGAIARYRPRAVLLMGIAAGIRDKIRIGEVVLSDRVVAYEPAALIRSASGMVVQPRPEIDRAPHTMIQDVVSYRAEAARLQDAFARAGGEVPSASSGQEDEFRAHVAAAITARQGTIASGEKLLRDPAKLLAVRELHGKTEVGEMEAAGLVDGCRRGSVPWLVIRGISDFGDELKDDRFHAFAACAAAAVMHDFLAHGLDLGPPWSPEARYSGGGAPPSLASNPFVFGRAIDRNEDFVGRVDERRWLREAIDKRQPVQLVGERLMGKTSLLRWVERTVLLDRPVIWLDPSRGLTPAAMVQSIARALGKPEAAALLDRPTATADHAGKVLDALVPFVLLVDDADALCSRGKGFEDGFFEAVRTLVQDGQLTWVSASCNDLYDTFRARGLTSRFLNDAKKLPVGPLSKAAAIELAQRGHAAAVATKMVDAVAGFAYGLQWLGDFVCRRPGQLDQACDAFADDVASTFQSWWAGLDPQERQLMKRCLAGDVIVAGLDRRASRSRADLARLLRRIAETLGRFGQHRGDQLYGRLRDRCRAPDD